MLKFIVKFLKALNSNSHPGEIAHAVCLGMLLGFLPKNNIFWFIITVFVLFMRINKGALVLCTLCFSLLAPLFDPLFDTVGYWFLTLPKLEPVFAWLLDIPFVGFTKFNNTIVMGSLLVSLGLYIPVYWLVRLFLKYWRAFLAPAVRKTKLVAFLSKLPLVVKIGEMS
jgi:uncharacterized protein (TIGR03546 family)